MPTSEMRTGVQATCDEGGIRMDQTISPARDTAEGGWASASVTLRLVAAFALMMIIACGIIGVAVTSIGGLIEGQRHVAVEAVPFMNGLNQAALAAKSAANDERGYLLAGAAKYREEALGRRADEKAGLDQARTAAGAQEHAALVADVSTKLDAFNTALDAEFARYPTDRTGATAASYGPNRDLRKTYESAFAVAISAGEQYVQAETGQQQRQAGSTRTLLFVLLGAFISAGVVLAWLLARAVSGPLRHLLAVLDAAGHRDLTVRATVSGAREFRGMAAATNDMLQATQHAVSTIAERAMTLSTTAQEMADTNRQIARASGDAARLAGDVSTTASQISSTVQAIATGAQEMGATIGEIATSASTASGVAAEAVSVAESAKETVAKLDESSAEIDVVVKTITSIAEQTNLLALNATIEAARAGEAGKGFAVVASEVKELAQETARATGDIAERISTIQEDTRRAIEAISRIGSVITEINQHQATIASTVEEQSATTQEMTRSIAEAAAGSTGMAGSIVSVAGAVSATTGDTDQARAAADSLAAMGQELRQLVGQFRY
jgi:methyl-accepting chemotaxis protein